MKEYKSTKEAEYEKLLREAQKQPGLVEYAKAYGQYDAVLAQARQYLGTRPPAEYLAATSTSQQD